MRPESIHPQLAADQDVTQFGEVRIDFVRYEARRADRPVQLTAIEFKILKFFVANPYRVISRDELLDKVWGTIAIR
jgi:two-component system OmpR family response regulator